MVLMRSGNEVSLPPMVDRASRGFGRGWRKYRRVSDRNFSASGGRGLEFDAFFQVEVVSRSCVPGFELCSNSTEGRFGYLGCFGSKEESIVDWLVIIAGAEVSSEVSERTRVYVVHWEYGFGEDESFSREGTRAFHSNDSK